MASAALEPANDLKAFRAETRAWLEANCPPSQRTPAQHSELVWPGRRQTFPSEDARLWFERMRDRGWTCPEFPKEYGGGGLEAAEAKILNEEMQALGCRPPLTDQGISMLGPALLEFGSEDQKREHLPKIVRGEIRWCQGYSEPGAGSDLASLQCKAEDRGDYLVVNGTKIWTSYGTESDWIFCLVRTSNEGPKQAGITFLLIDMETPGVSATPIELISGQSEFAQIFFVDVEVPKKNVVHDLHQGWTVAKALLKHERKMMAELGRGFVGGSLSLEQAARDYGHTDEDGRVADGALRDRLAEHKMDARAIALTGYRNHLQQLAGVSDPAVAGIMKYVGTRQAQVRDELLVELLGLNGLGWKDPSFASDELRAARELLFNKALTIAGGTSEIQLNIIAKRLLQLPSE